ncbi:MAG: hypothetical protein SGJ19_08485 [Planctomycetia bacterium]|nr:hypothetical protein [Planctomycetia bacterium]
MKTYSRHPNRGNDHQLAHVIEPLASYICSSNRPQCALASVLAMLVSEVEQTIQAANSHLASSVKSN